MFHPGLEKLKQEEGSISILVVGLFFLLLSLSLILTDISAIYLAKRSLNQNLEAATQRALSNLDQDSYYTGEYNLNQLELTILGDHEEDPGIPINCDEGEKLAIESLNGLTTEQFSSIQQISEIEITKYQCNGFEIFMEARALVKLPVPIPFTQIFSAEIRTHSGGIVERAKTNNYYGFDIG